MKEKTVLISIDPVLHYRFKVLCAIQGITMQKGFVKAIELLIASPAPEQIEIEKMFRSEKETT